MPVTDPASARILVYNVVVAWVAKQTNNAANTIDVARTFVDNPPDGYGFSDGGYLQMCDGIIEPITTVSGRALKLPGAWRVKHKQDKIADFINATAVQLISAPLTPAGVSAHTWAMGS